MVARTPTSIATAVAAGHDRTRYDAVAMALHWLTLALVLTQFTLALTWGDFARPTRHLMVVAHMSFGILLGAAVCARIVWRLIPGHQMPPADSGVAELAAKAVHYLLYAMLLAEFVLGFVLRWSGNEAMSCFGVAIPSPMTPLSKPAHGFIGDLHEWNGYAIVALAGAHAAAALFHHFVLRDNVLRRMLPAGLAPVGANRRGP